MLHTLRIYHELAAAYYEFHLQSASSGEWYDPLTEATSIIYKDNADKDWWDAYPNVPGVEAFMKQGIVIGRRRASCLFPTRCTRLIFGHLAWRAPGWKRHPFNVKKRKKEKKKKLRVELGGGETKEQAARKGGWTFLFWSYCVLRELRLAPPICFIWATDNHPRKARTPAMWSQYNKILWQISCRYDFTVAFHP